MSPSPSPSPAQDSRSPSPPDIAAAMGFTSFGAKPNPPKKRRKIARTDEDHEGSGSNNTPLGMRAIGKAKVMEHGLEYDIDEEGNGEGGPKREMAVSGGEGYENGGREEDYGELNKRTMPLVDGRVESTDPPGPNISHSYGQQQNSFAASRNPQEEQMLEEARQRGLKRLEQMAQMRDGGRRADGQWDWGALRRGVRDERGDMAFYDASFVEDPWRGLQTREAIPSRPSQDSPKG